MRYVQADLHYVAVAFVGGYGKSSPKELSGFLHCVDCQHYSFEVIDVYTTPNFQEHGSLGTG